MTEDEGEEMVGDMTLNEAVALWRIADCPIRIERLEEGARLQWSDDPLDFIDLSPKQLGQLAERVAEVRQ